MKFMRLALIFCALSWLVSHAHAQGGMMPGPGTVHSAGSSYTGPGDVVTGASMAVGLASYNAAYATGSNPAADICDAATGLTCSTINFLSNGNFDTTTASASAACAVSCVVKKLYDSTGNGHHCTQATLAQMPVLTFNAIGALPGLTFTSSSSQNMTCGTAPFTTQPNTLFAVAKHTVVGFSGQSLFSSGNVSFLLEYEAGGGPNEIDIYDGTLLSATATDNAYHIIQGIFGGSGASTSAIVVDATTTTGTISGAAASGTIGLASRGGGGQFADLVGQIWIAYGGVALNGTQRTNLCHNQFLYWGTPTSC